MNKFTYRLATGITTGAIVLSAMTPAAFAATKVKVTDNGNNSKNTVVVLNEKTNLIQQVNTAVVGNITVVAQNTGSNKANDNNKGDVKIKTGSTSSVVTNITTTGGNVASTPCGCEDAKTKVAVTDNGKNSKNTVVVSNNSVTQVVQSNTAIVVNGTAVLQNTGNNKANDNNKGDVKIKAGDTQAEVTNGVMTEGNEVTQ